MFYVLNKSLKKGDFWGFFKDLAKSDPDARAHVANFGNRLSVQLFDPKLIKEFYAQQHKYTKMEFSPAFGKLLGTGVILAEGNLWKHHRKQLSTLFHFEFIRDNIPLVVNTTREFLDKLKDGPLDNVDIMDEVQKITGEIVGRIFFGENLSKYTIDGQPLTLYLANLLVDIFNERRRLVALLLALTGLRSLSPLYRNIIQRVDKFRKVCLDIVKERKASNIQVNDMLALMLNTQNNPNKEEAFSDEDIINEFITFFTAGMDTTGHLITMVLNMLHNNRQYLENLESERKNIYNREDPISQESISQMEFTHALLKETLRFYAPAPGVLPRVAEVDHNILDIEIKKGMVVMPQTFFNFMNHKYFKDPETFLPERWLTKSTNMDPYVYIPFSAGARNCIGQHLSIIESKIILAEFLKRFDFELPKDYKLQMTMAFLYEPAQKITMKLTPKPDIK